MGPLARIPIKDMSGEIVGVILTMLLQKVVSLENSTVAWVIIMFEFIEDILTFGLHFVMFFSN